MAASNTPETKPIAKTLAENVKDTLESIVVAFILAFVFRAFIVEAFVIPTGSMAVTLYGNQITKTCSTCGFEYAVGITERMQPYALKLRCPNCDTFFDELTPSEITHPDSGDRILVHKWPLDVGGDVLGPHRWDVTVFKDPRDGTTNFIKRLIGLPGEVIEIIDGDIYAVKVKDLKPDLVEKMNQLRLDVYALRDTEQSTNRRQHEVDVDKERFIRRYAEINEQVLPLMKIQRKLPHQTLAQDSLWFNVFNQDFLPNYRSADRATGGANVGWRTADPASATAWNTSAREITFNSDLPQTLTTQLAGKEIDDFYAYNLEGLSPPGDRQHVGDVRLRFEWIPDAGDGGLALSINRDDDEFSATLTMDGRVKVEGDQPEIERAGHHQVIDDKKLSPFVPGRAVAIEFINLDYRVSLWIDGQEVIASSPEQYSPQLAKLKKFISEAQKDSRSGYVDVKPTSVRVGAHNLHCRLRHVAVERDVYYRSQGQPEEGDPDARAGINAYNPYYRWPGWATSGMPMFLRTAHQVGGQEFGGEYFMMGDNSPASKDSRLWWEIGPHLRRLKSDYQVGTVPDDQLIGKAFFVYWPAGYRPSWSPGVGLIPNFGRMRWIR